MGQQRRATTALDGLDGYVERALETNARGRVGAWPDPAFGAARVTFQLDAAGTVVGFSVEGLEETFCRVGSS